MDFEDRVRKYAIDLVNEATGGDADCTEELSEASDIARDNVITILQRKRIPLARELVADIDLVFDGEEPHYFIPHNRAAELYKENHGFVRSSPRNSSDSLRHVGEGVDSFIAHLQDTSYWLLTPYRRGAACVEEQRFFYETEEWKNRSAVVRIMDRFTCQHCGKPGHEVHHDEHIYSVFSPKFYRNFDVVRLRCLCSACHQVFHNSHVRGFSEFVSGTRGDLRRNGQDRRILERIHDEARQCEFCFGEHRRAA